MHKCPDCHAIVDDEAFFCDQCGFQLRPRPGAPAPGPAVGSGTSSAEAGAVVQDEHRLAPAIPGAAQAACPACGYVNMPGEIFCAHCGVQLISSKGVAEPSPIPLAEAAPLVEAAAPLPMTGVKRCPSCGTDNTAGETYCQNCGFWLTAQTLPAPPAAGPEPRQTFVQTNFYLSDQPSAAHLEQPLAQVPATPHEALHSIAITGRLFSTTTEASLLLPSKAEIILGRRDPERGIYPDVDLSDQGTVSSSVSRQHARLSVLNQQIYVEDLNSTNSTFLNRQRLQPGQRYLLGNGDELRLGGVALIYYSN